MKKLIMGMILMLGLSSVGNARPMSNYAGKGIDYAVLLGVGYDNNSLMKDPCTNLTVLNPTKPIVSLTILGDGPRFLTGWTITNNGGILVNVGFKF